MAIAPVPKRDKDSSFHVTESQSDSVDWVRIAAGTALLAGGLLLLTGQKRAAMAVAAAGTALAMLDQQEMLRSWWRELPGYIDQVQKHGRQACKSASGRDRGEARRRCARC